jgi:hypothetical protein
LDPNNKNFQQRKNVVVSRRKIYYVVVSGWNNYYVVEFPGGIIIMKTFFLCWKFYCVIIKVAEGIFLIQYFIQFHGKFLMALDEILYKDSTLWNFFYNEPLFSLGSIILLQ